jgi:hypothetical protein
LVFTTKEFYANIMAERRITDDNERVTSTPQKRETVPAHHARYEKCAMAFKAADKAEWRVN